MVSKKVLFFSFLEDTIIAISLIPKNLFVNKSEIFTNIESSMEKLLLNFFFQM